MKHVKLILYILVGLVVVVIVVQNHTAMSTSVSFRINTLFFGEKTTSLVSLYAIVFLTFILGVVLTGLYGIVERFRLKKRIKVLTRELREKENELSSLRNLPITSDDVGTVKTESVEKE